MAGKGGPMRKKSAVPPPAKYPVRCDKSSTGKHDPQTFEGKDADGNKIKWKACRACGGTLK